MKFTDEASDQELNILIDLYKEYETIQEKVIYEVAVELKSYRDLEKYRDAILQDEPEGQAQALPDYSSEQSCRIR